jgi:hypothetical protein
VKICIDHEDFFGIRGLQVEVSKRGAKRGERPMHSTRWLNFIDWVIRHFNFFKVIEIKGNSYIKKRPFLLDFSSVHCKNCSYF